MGYNTKFNFVLKLSREQGLNNEPGEHSFEKSSERIYPIGIPIILADENMDAIAIAKVLEFSCEKDKTKGRYEITRLLTEEEKKAFDMYLHLK